MGVTFKIILLVLFASSVAALIEINEIMYNPEGNDNNFEWIEIYSDSLQNYSGYFISDFDSNDSLQLLFYFPGNFSLIVEEGFNYTGINASIYSAGKTIGNNLNDEERIFFYDPNWILIDNVYYNSSMGGKNNNLSLEKSEHSWHESLEAGGTPGRENSVQILSNREIDYSQIKITEFLPDPVGEDVAALPEGEWIELYNKKEDLDLQGLYFKDSSGHKIYVTDINVRETTTIKKGEHLLFYLNGKSLLNNDGPETLYLYDYYDHLLEEVSYADPVEGNSYAFVEGIGWQHTKPTPGEKNVNYNVVKETNFLIEGISDLGSDNTAKFGQMMRVKVNLYKGDSSKNVIRLWVENKDEKISKESKVTLPYKYTNITLEIPLQLYPNCNEKYEKGGYEVKVGWVSESSALDAFPLEVEGLTSSLCEKVEVEKKAMTKNKFSFSLEDYPVVVDSGEKFDITVKVQGDNKEHELELWSYAFRGSKSYSGEREANKKTVDLGENEIKTIRLPLQLDAGMDAGEYKIKLNLRKDDQKTVKEVTEVFQVEELEPRTLSQENVVLTASAESDDYNLGVDKSERKGVVVYESSSVKAKNLLPIILAVTFALLCLVLVWKEVGEDVRGG